MRPGTNTTVTTQRPPLTPPVNTGTWFVAGITSQGPIAPQVATSFGQWQTIYGQRGTNPTMSDCVETYFNEGGSSVVTARVVGPSAVNATIALLGASSAPSISVTAIGPGTYANGYKVVVTGSGPYTLTIEDSNSNVLEISNSLATVADAVAYGTTSSYVTVVATGTVIPTAGTFTLAAGADDLADITTAQYTAALALFLASFGPGQVSAPGQTTSAILTAVLAHANAFSRIALLDLPDSNVAATLIGDIAPITALGTQARVAGAYTPWFDIAPAAGTSGGVRAIPPSAFVAGRMAANDAASGNPNLPCAGVNGILNTAVNAHAAFIDSDRQLLNTAGINVIRPMANGFRIYGNVTPVNRVTDPLYFMLSNSRLDMAIFVAAQAIQENYMFSQIDGLGYDASQFGGDLVAMMLDWYANKKALFGDTAQDAFSVDTSSDINTPVTEAQGELMGTIAYTRSPGAEQVNLNLVRVSAAQGV